MALWNVVAEDRPEKTRLNPQYIFDGFGEPAKASLKSAVLSSGRSTGLFCPSPVSGTAERLREKFQRAC
jgi:hypothetical protein